MSLSCPNCNSTHIKKNGHIHNGKQNHCCKECGRQFVFNPQQILISSAKRERIQRLLIERIPLRGICRTEGVSLRWLLGFMVDLYDQSHFPHPLKWVGFSWVSCSNFRLGNCTLLENLLTEGQCRFCAASMNTFPTFSDKIARQFGMVDN